MRPPKQKSQANKLPRMNRCHEFLVVEGAGGFALYVDDQRLAGPKPFGGGTEVATWWVDTIDLDMALKR